MPDAGAATRSPMQPLDPAAQPSSAETGRRLAHTLLIYMLAVTALITLLPFRFEWPQAPRILLFGSAVDVVANVLLFVPLGFLWCYARPHAKRSRPMAVVILGAGLSVLIETTQLFESTRTTSPADVIANAVGALLGALAYRRVAGLTPRGSQLVGWLGLELPLMGLVYLLVPLLWIHSLASQGSLARALMTVLIGVFGAIVLGGIQRNYFGPARAAGAHETAAFAALWFMAGAFPALPWQPLGLIVAAVAVGLVCWWQGSLRAFRPGTNRRFEVPLLRAAAPVYAGYLTLTLLSPLDHGVGTWSLVLGFPLTMAEQVEIMRLLELIAAFTLVGYMTAEFQGRRADGYRNVLPRLIAWGVGLAICAETVRGFEQTDSASGARGVILACAVLYGGWLYYLQRAHVMRLLAERARA